MNDKLPPGQRPRGDFPRFGLTPYAYRFPRFPTQAQLALSGDVLDDTTLDSPLVGLVRVEHTCDFHCVTTWTRQQVQWGGVRFTEFYSRHIAPRVREGAQVRTVVLGGQDGYRTTLPLSELLAKDVLVADRLDGVQLSIKHGAPLRLVAPAHYGYKSVKHLSRIEIWQGEPNIRPAGFAFMDHPRARVAYEERGRWLPGWFLRFAYSPLIRFTAERFAKALALHQLEESRHHE